MPLEADDDLDLVNQCRKGNLKAYELLFMKYRQKIFNRCAVMLKDTAEDPESAAQDILFKVYREIGQFQGGSKFSTWVFSIMRNHCLTLLKKSNAARILVDLDGLQIPSAAAEPESAVDEDCVQRKISEMPKKYREVILRVHFDDLEYSEAARRLNCPVGTVRSRLFRALKQLGPRLEECVGQ